MNILKKLFGFKQNQKQAVNYENLDSDDSLNSIPFPSKEMFIDESSPEELEVTQELNSVSINKFLDEDYYQMGVNEGFSLHSNESAQSRKKLIKSNFRNLLNQLIDQNKEEVLRLKNSTVDVADLSFELKEKLENKIDFLMQEIDELNQQKTLSSQDEGFVMSAIHNYHQGFLTGLKSHLEMEKLITKTY